jgi:aspartyl-tRNA(Asn)/glutamyl-tRNA(Gln) amidotransferase subunit A
MKIDFATLTIAKAHDHLTKGDFTAVELAEHYLAEIEKKNPNLNAYLEVFTDVKAQAAAADLLFKNKKAGLLTGIPLAIKDNILIAGRRVGSASKILEGYKATYDATAIQKLKEAGAVFLGRTNMDEFAMGGSTENSAYGVTKNPHDEGRVAGGSSGGSAAAVAMNGALAALGSDTGGSVRQPGSFCGVVGFKPTYGAISRHGLMAMGSSLDQIGPITRSVADAEILFNAMKGKDRFDGTSRDFPKPPAPKKKFVIGVPRDFTSQGGIDPAVVKNLEASIELLKKQGCEVRDISLKNIKYSLAVYYILMPAEVSSNLARFDGVKYGLHKEGETLLEDYLVTRADGFGREARRRIILGTYVLSAGYYDAYYNKANAVRELITQDFKQCFDSGIDAVLTPTTPAPAFKIGEKTADPLSMYLADIFTVTANIAGVPAISIPSGTQEIGGKKLPLGIQFTANYGREDILFSIGKIFEEAVQ